MAVTMVGIVYYLDDPEKKVFRKVYPSLDDSELDDPQWVTLGIDPSRIAWLEKVPVGGDPPMTGTP